MYNPEQAIDTAYNFIQNRKNSNYKYLSTPIYDVSKTDLKKLMGIAHKYGIPFEWMVNLINFESGGTFNPAIRNSIGATGLIQFMTKIGGKTMTYSKADGSSPVTTESLKKMSFSQQLDYVDGFLFRNLKRFLDSNGKIPKTFTQGDIFMTIFYPVAIGNPNYVFPSVVQQANGGIKMPKDYVLKALKNPIFPISAFPYTLKEVEEKFRDIMTENTYKPNKRNLMPIYLMLIGLGGLTYYFIKTKKLKINF